ncbi:hypothetical protein DFH06DRAFT_1171089, partial [Mycena polygramma]
VRSSKKRKSALAARTPCFLRSDSLPALARARDPVLASRVLSSTKWTEWACFFDSVKPAPSMPLTSPFARRPTTAHAVRFKARCSALCVRPIVTAQAQEHVAILLHAPPRRMARNFVRSDVLPLFQITKYHPSGLLFHYAACVRPELAGRTYTGPPQPTRGAQPMLAQFRSNPAAAAVRAAHSRGDVLFLPGRAARCTRRPSAGLRFAG